jgi:hypothetical protein
VDFKDNTGVKFWKFHGVGEGLKSNLKIDNVQQSLSYVVKSPFPDHFPLGQPPRQKSSKTEVTVIACTVVGCETIFQSIHARDLHILNGQHYFSRVVTTADKMKMLYVEKITKETEAKCLELSTRFLCESNSTTSSINTHYEKMGHALKKRKAFKHLNMKQKQFIYNAFIKGEETGRKISAENLSQMFRTIYVRSSWQPIISSNRVLNKTTGFEPVFKIGGQQQK